jgi:hypothetical protein
VSVKGREVILVGQVGLAMGEEIEFDKLPAFGENDLAAGGTYGPCDADAPQQD